MPAIPQSGGGQSKSLNNSHEAELALLVQSNVSKFFLSNVLRIMYPQPPKPCSGVFALLSDRCRYYQTGHGSYSHDRSRSRLITASRPPRRCAASSRDFSTIAGVTSRMRRAIEMLLLLLACAGISFLLHWFIISGRRAFPERSWVGPVGEDPAVQLPAF